jgi:hypothetical protein
MLAQPFLTIAILIMAVWLAAWTVRRLRRRARHGSPVGPSPQSAPARPPELGSFETGAVTGLLGGSVEDAAIADFALRRAEAARGEKRTAADVGFAAGLQSALRRDPDPPAPGAGK